MDLKRYAIVNSNNAVTNVVEYPGPPGDPPPGFPDGTRAIQNDTVGPDWSFDGTNFTAPVQSVTIVIPSISDRQFFQQLAVLGIISQDEALAAVSTGTIPPAMAPLISALPVDEQFSAKMILSGATTFERNHPMTQAIGSAYGMSSDQIDQLFLAASQL